MKYLVLQPGETVCVPADSIQAWLSGDIVECMPSILASVHGQTDSIDLFTSALTFDPHSAEQSRPEMLEYEGAS
jgi:mannose-6-phosphate isomerase